MAESKLKTFLKKIKYQFVLKFKPRVNRVYTQFYRFPNQYKALVDKIIPRYTKSRVESGSDPFEIVLFACSTGAEPFSLAYVLRTHFPELNFRIRAFDIVDEVLEKAKLAVYSGEEVHHSPFMFDAFVEGTFNRVGNEFHVKPELTKLVSFDKGDLLNKAFMQSLGQVDLVVAQNVLFHLPPPNAQEAFVCLYEMLKPEATLLVNGMDMDMRIKLTKQYNLRPLEYLIEEIHDDARVDQGAGWSKVYWGREPFSKSAKEWTRKYGTIFSRVQI